MSSGISGSFCATDFRFLKLFTVCVIFSLLLFNLDLSFTIFFNNSSKESMLSSVLIRYFKASSLFVIFLLEFNIPFLISVRFFILSRISSALKVTLKGLLLIVSKLISLIKVSIFEAELSSKLL